MIVKLQTLRRFVSSSILYTQVSRFLRTQTELNKALTEVDRKKERKRNFVSAKTGFLTCLELVFSYFFFSIFYAFKVS